jgi:hypothetical protein
MKRYHDSLRQVYAIITTEISSIDLEIALQMTFKTLNDSIEFDDLILILLVFEAYSQRIKMNVSLLTIIQRVIIIIKFILVVTSSRDDSCERDYMQLRREKFFNE